MIRSINQSISHYLLFSLYFRKYNNPYFDRFIDEMKTFRVIEVI